MLDPNTLSADGTVSLTNQAFSHDGTLLAYGTSASGSDWQEIHIRRIATGEDYAEVIHWCKFSGIAWKHDNSGFFYNRLPEPGTVPEEDQSKYSKVYLHTINTPQADDVLIFEWPEEKELSFTPMISYDGQYLFLYVWNGTDPHNRLYYREEKVQVPLFASLMRLTPAMTSLAMMGLSSIFKRTYKLLRAVLWRLIVLILNGSTGVNYSAEQDDVIAFAAIVNQQFVLGYMHDAHHQIRLYSKDGTLLQSVALPMLGSIGDFSGEPDGNEFFITFTSFLYPSAVFRYDFEHDTLTPVRQLQTKFDPANYETTQIFYPSKDGAQIPMFLTHKKGLVRDGNNPVIIYGYGGFNISITPTFGITPLLWIEHGGIYAVANLRGGDEYGEQWHQAGMLEKKQNVFDDFIAAAEWLIEQKYTQPARVSIMGGSNGGLLVAASLVQRPDLYGAVICRVPVIDMLRYHRFTVGRYWISEYGDAEHNIDQFKFMYAYSPLHNVRSGVSYPPTLIMTADTDDRVVPAHARKFAATLQAAQQGDAPILLRVAIKAGHGLGKPTAKVIEEESDLLAFLFQTFDMH